MTEIVIEQEIGSIMLSDSYSTKDEMIIKQDGFYIFVLKSNIPAIISALQQLNENPKTK